MSAPRSGSQARALACTGPPCRHTDQSRSLRRELPSAPSRRAGHPRPPARAHADPHPRRAPPARPHALLRRGRRRRDRGRRAHDAVRDPRPAVRPLSPGARARRRDGERRASRRRPALRADRRRRRRHRAGGARGGDRRTLGYDAALLSLAALARRPRRRARPTLPRGRRGDPARSASTSSPPSAAGCSATGSGASSPRSTSLVAVKIAPFDRYARSTSCGVAESGRDDVALYTGNDDNIVPTCSRPSGRAAAGARSTADRRRAARPLGGVDAARRRAARAMSSARTAAEPSARSTPRGWLGAAHTDANAAIFDAAHGFAGCIPGIHEVLRRQGLMQGIWTPQLRARTLARPGRRDRQGAQDVPGADGRRVRGGESG